MDSRSVPAAVRWAIATWPEQSERGAVSAFCCAHAISRSVFYKIRARARAVGPMDAVEPGSRRPVSSPGRTDPQVIEQALQMRAWLVARGLDAGPLSVAARMRRLGLRTASRATLARAFVAAGVVKPEPRKKPRAAYRRFVYPAPNCCWQIDAMEWSLADGRKVAIFQLIDDHSRLALASLVATGETSAAALQVVRTAIRRWGVPVKFLSDNGAAFNPTRRGSTGKLVDYLTTLGTVPITGRPGRPTTQGKDERLHRTLIKWLNARTPARTIPELQTLVEDHDDYYNHEREHQSLGGRTPWETWLATDLADEPDPRTHPEPLPAAPPLAREERHIATRTVSDRGRFAILGCEFQVGKARAHTTVHALWDHTHIEFFDETGTSFLRLQRPPKGVHYLGSRNRPSTMSRDNEPSTMS